MPINIAMECKRSGKRKLHNITELSYHIFQPLKQGLLYFISSSSHNNSLLQQHKYQKICVNVESKTTIADHDKVSGYFICFSKPAENIYFPEVLFKCNNKEYILTVYLCDRQKDCADSSKRHIGSDEKYCL